jgi:hypothetical protein
LGFWKLRSGRLQSELLPALTNLRENILFTSQIVDEVLRNRLSVFLAEASMERVPEPPALPSHLMKGDAGARWNEKHKTAMEQLQTLKSDWDIVLRDLAIAISRGEDPVSVELAPLFALAQDATPEQFARARSRRESGNPPGKKSDPLGDQVSWEQFLDSSEKQPLVWIITRDGDFCYQLDKKLLLLNPLLHSDLNRRGVKEYRIFDNLADAINDIKSSGIAVEDTPPSERLAEIGKELETIPHALGWDPPTDCPHCRSRGSMGPLVPLRSRYGGLTYQSICRACGFHWDAGEPYD